VKGLVVRIPYANIPAQAVRISSPPATAAAKSIGKAQLLEPRDSYDRQGRQTGAQVIDAEYVEFYSPSTKVLAKERQDLDISLEAAPDQGQAAAQTQRSGNPAISSYQTVPTEPPPLPGSYIDTFA